MSCTYSDAKSKDTVKRVVLTSSVAGAVRCRGQISSCVRFMRSSVHLSMVHDHAAISGVVINSALQPRCTCAMRAASRYRFPD